MKLPYKNNRLALTEGEKTMIKKSLTKRLKEKEVLARRKMIAEQAEGALRALGYDLEEKELTRKREDPMTLKESIKEAVENKDAETIGKIVNRMRVVERLNYDGCYKIFKDVTGISIAEYDEFLYESDNLESR